MNRDLINEPNNSADIKKRSLIILGMGPSAWQCPWDTEVWGLNMGWELARQDGHKLDKLFLAHSQVFSSEGNPFFNWEEISKQEFEVISLHKIKGLNSTLFPLRRIKRKFQTEYFSNTVCYMIAYALDKCSTSEGKLKRDAPYERLRFYGVDILTDEEMSWEKGGIEHWLGIAKGLGLGIEISYNSTLLRTDRPKLPISLLNKGVRNDGNAVIGMIEIVADDIKNITAGNLIKVLGG